MWLIIHAYIGKSDTDSFRESVVPNEKLQSEVKLEISQGEIVPDVSQTQSQTSEWV